MKLEQCLVAFDRRVWEVLDDGLIKAFVPDAAVALPSDGSLIEDNPSIGKQMLLENPTSLVPNRLPHPLRSSRFNDFQAFSKLVNMLKEIPCPRYPMQTP